MADAVEQLKVDRAFIQQDHRVDISVMHGNGDRDFTLPYRCFAADMALLPPWVDRADHA